MLLENSESLLATSAMLRVSPTEHHPGIGLSVVPLESADGNLDLIITYKEMISGLSEGVG